MQRIHRQIIAEKCQSKIHKKNFRVGLLILILTCVCVQKWLRCSRRQMWARSARGQASRQRSENSIYAATFRSRSNTTPRATRSPGRSRSRNSTTITICHCFLMDCARPSIRLSFLPAKAFTTCSSMVATKFYQLFLNLLFQSKVTFDFGVDKHLKKKINNFV